MTDTTDPAFTLEPFKRPWCFNNRALISKALRDPGYAAGIEAAAKVCDMDADRRWREAEDATNAGNSAKADWHTAGEVVAKKLAIAIRALTGKVGSRG